ncbi:conserved hypothetical protein [Alphaproteobacteria bacterium]
MVDNRHTYYYNFKMDVVFNFNYEKNLKLINGRGISFEQIISLIRDGKVIDVLAHYNQDQYGSQKIDVIDVEGYCYLSTVPFVEREDEIFLKTIIPSRKMTKLYMRQK